jgi:hypothetical protein
VAIADAFPKADALARTITLAAALNGVLQVGRLSRIAPELLDGERLAAALLNDILLGWGAAPAALAKAHRQLDALATRGSLARSIPETT